MKCLWHGALIAYSPMGSMARCLSAGRQGEGMMAMRIELEDVLFQLRQAEIELHIAIGQHRQCFARRLGDRSNSEVARAFKLVTDLLRR